MPKYTVTANVTHTYDLQVDAPDEDDAIEQAEQQLNNGLWGGSLEPNSTDWDTDNWDVEEAEEPAEPEDQATATEGFV